MKFPDAVVHDFEGIQRNFEALAAAVPTTAVIQAVNVFDPQWGMTQNTDGTWGSAALFQAIFDKYLNEVASFGGSARIFFPAISTGYRLEKALIRYSRIRIVGEQSVFGEESTGSVTSRFVAKSGGAASDFTNTGTYGAHPAAAMLKQQGSSAATWDHGASVEDIAFDPNGIAGLSGMASWSPGENTLFDRLTCDGTVATARSVSDAVTNSTTTVTSATASFTVEDVNAVVTGTNLPASTKIDQVVNGTTVTLNNAATGSGSGGSLTINRPTDAFLWEGGSAHMTAGTLRGAHNTGAVLRLKGYAGGAAQIGCVSGDNNGGGLIRISSASAAGDPATITVGKIKSENSVAAGTGSSVITMDPVILMDSCDMVALNVLGGIAITGYNSRDIVRLDQSVTSRGGPSVYLCGIEPNNPFNTQYTNLIHDTQAGEVIAAPAMSAGFLTSSNGPRLYPVALYGRDLLIGGGGHIPSVDPWKAAMTFLSAPDATYNSSGWALNQISAALYGIVAFNSPVVQNDGAAWYINLSRGTWKMDLAYLQGGALAIITVDVSFDGGSAFTSIGTVDAFGGASAQRATFTGITVPKGGPALVRFRALSKNGGSTGYGLNLSGMVWTRSV